MLTQTMEIIMGWLFHTTDYGRKAFIEERTRNEENAKTKWECLAFSDKKKHLWKVIRKTDKETNESITFIALDMISKERNSGWGYKDLDESCGFCQMDCPKKFLAMTNAPRNNYATEWYAKMNEAKPKAVKKEVGGIYKLIETASIYGYNNLTAEILYKRTPRTFVCKVTKENGDIVSNSCGVGSYLFAK